MKKIISKTFLSIFNIIFLGIGFAVTQRLSLALLLPFICYLTFAISGLFGFFSSFVGFLFCYGTIIFIYLYAFFAFIFTKYSGFQNWKKNVLIYCIAVIFMKMAFVFPVRQYLFEPRKYNNDFFMTDKRNGQEAKPLYIFWSDNFSLIGHNFSDK